MEAGGTVQRCCKEETFVQIIIFLVLLVERSLLHASTGSPLCCSLASDLKHFYSYLLILFNCVEYIHAIKHVWKSIPLSPMGLREQIGR